MLARPHVERGARHFVDKGHGKTELAEIDAFQIMPTGVAGVDAQVLELRRLEVAEMSLVFLSAGWAQHTTERP